MAVAPERLTGLDAGFLALESPQAPMHLGWAATFSPPANGARPTFAALRAHIEARLGRAPRYRQRLAAVPLALADPVWIDDQGFDIACHVRRAFTTDLGELADEVMSVPLAPDRPLWELWIAERLDDGRIGVVGKAHHCLVDGLAAIELMALLLDPAPDAPADEPDLWRPARAPGAMALAQDALRHRAANAGARARRALRLVRKPPLARHLAGSALADARAVAQAALPLAPPSPLNGGMSPGRHLAWLSRPLSELELIERRLGATINDVLLAASAGALRDLPLSGGQTRPLKAMVPVSVRAPQERWGNRIAFLFPDLPTHEPDPVTRLSAVHEAMCARKRANEAGAADRVMGAVSRMPRVARHIGSRLLTSRRLYNLTISNVPGPASPLYLMGCEVKRVYPVVPLAARHGISICMTSFNGTACFGVYADARRAAHADRLARALGAAIDELVARSEVRGDAPAARRTHDRTRDNSRNRQGPGAPSAPRAAAA